MQRYTFESCSGCFQQNYVHYKMNLMTTLKKKSPIARGFFALTKIGFKRIFIIMLGNIYAFPWTWFRRFQYQRNFVIKFHLLNHWLTVSYFFLISYLLSS